jgi:hypothetical protein
LPSVALTGKGGAPAGLEPRVAGVGAWQGGMGPMGTTASLESSCPGRQRWCLQEDWLHLCVCVTASLVFCQVCSLFTNKISDTNPIPGADLKSLLGSPSL